MDVRATTLHLVERRAQTIVFDTGLNEHTLTGTAYTAIEEAAHAFFAALETQLGEACHTDLREIAIDFVARTVRMRRGGAQAQLPDVLIERDVYQKFLPMLTSIARAVSAGLRSSRIDPQGTPSDPAYWDALYRIEQDGWELGRAAPPLERWFRANPPAGKRVLVVGSGRGHEAQLLARLGATVTAVDFSTEAVTQARELAAAAGLSVNFQVADLFDLAQSNATFDVVVEHTCFCAIEPQRRAEYVRVMAHIVVPGGQLVGLFYTHGRPGGPPFTTSEQELKTLFAPYFSLQHSETPTDSIATRLGDELLQVWLANRPQSAV